MSQTTLLTSTGEMKLLEPKVRKIQQSDPRIDLKLDIYRESKLDISEAFEKVRLDYGKSIDSQVKMSKEAMMREYHIDNKIIYPSDMLTFRVDPITRQKVIRWLSFYFRLNGNYHVDLLLEDSQRSI